MRIRVAISVETFRIPNSGEPNDGDGEVADGRRGLPDPNG